MRISLWATAAGFLWLADYVIGINLLARGMDSFSLSGLGAWMGLFIVATVIAQWKQTQAFHQAVVGFTGLLLLACSGGALVLDSFSSGPDATRIGGQVAVLASALISLLCLARAAAYALAVVPWLGLLWTLTYMMLLVGLTSVSKDLVERLGGWGWLVWMALGARLLHTPYWRQLLQPEAEPPSPRWSPLQANLKPYEGEEYHRMTGLMVGPDQDIVLCLRFRRGIGDGYFEYDGQRLQVEPGPQEGLQDVLRGMAFEHSITKTGGWCPAQLALEGGRWTLDLHPNPGVVTQPQRCWFDLKRKRLAYQTVPPDQLRPRRKGPRLLTTYTLASGPPDRLLQARIYDGEVLTATLLWQGKVLRATVCEEGEGDQAATELIEGNWLHSLWRLQQPGAFEKEGLVCLCSLDAPQAPRKRQDWRIEIDPAKLQARVHYSGLGEAEVLRCSSEGLSLLGRFRQKAGRLQVQILHQGRPLTIHYRGSDSRVTHSGYSREESEEVATWLSQGEFPLTLLNRRPLELQPQGGGRYSAQHAEDSDHHDVTYRSSLRINLNLPGQKLEIQVESHLDMT